MRTLPALTMRVLVAVGAAIAGVVAMPNAARAEDPMCSARYTGRANQIVTGHVSTRVGRACRLVFMAHYHTRMAGAQVLSRPKHGAAIPLDHSSVRYVPKPGFSGQDTMSLRVFMTSQRGRLGSGILNLQILVY